MIDFIDMARARNRDAVMKTLRKTLDEDRTKTFTAEISKLGLVEMTRQNVTEGVREIMSRPCPTCEGEGVIRSEETIAIEFERRLRDVAAEHPDAEAFLVQINPRVSTQFTGHGSRVLHALEAQTGKSFLFEGSEGLALDHFAITFMGTREEVEERALPFRQGDEVLVEIVEPHMYDVDDAVAKIDGYIISIAGAAPYVGEKRMVRIDQVGRTAASALLLDESGEVVTAPMRAVDTRAKRAWQASFAGALRRGGRRRLRASSSRARPPAPRRRADSEDAEARREAGLSDTPTAIDSEPEEEPAVEMLARAGASSPAPTLAGRGRRGWPTIQASASWPQRRTAPFGCQGQGDPRVADGSVRRQPAGGARTSHRIETDTDMYAIVKTGGKQYRVERGQKLLVERLPAAEGADVTLEPMLYRSEEAVFDTAGLEQREGHRQGRRARARREAARVQVQAQARLQTAHRPPPGAHPDRGHRDHRGRRETGGQSEQGQTRGRAEPDAQGDEGEGCRWLIRRGSARAATVATQTPSAWASRRSPGRPSPAARSSCASAAPASSRAPAWASARTTRSTRAPPGPCSSPPAGAGGWSASCLAGRLGRLAPGGRRLGGERCFTIARGSTSRLAPAATAA